MMSKRKRTWLVWTVVLLVVAGAGIGLYMFNNRTKDYSRAEPAAILSLDAFTGAFAEDSAKAWKEYGEKPVRVTGTVQARDSSGAITLSNKAGDQFVICGLDRRHIEDQRSVSPGQLVTIQGLCTGYEPGEEMLGMSTGLQIHLGFSGLIKN